MQPDRAHTLNVAVGLARWAVCALWLALAPAAQALDKVVLQLRWEHEFQFAGYYAALWQGYYAREGLDVEIRPAATPEGRLLDAEHELVAGNAQFAVGDSDILTARGRGDDVVILAPVFQRSAVALFALEQTRLTSPADLPQLRIAAYADQKADLDLREMLRESGIDDGAVARVNEPPLVDSLVSGKADVIVTYGVSAEHRAAELGVKLRSLHPADFGVQRYGDTLYTTGALARQQPELAARFTRASLEGWRYAHAHRTAIADRISATLPRYVYRYDDFAGYNRTFAKLLDELTLYPGVELGTSDRNQWQRAYTQLFQAGLIATPFRLEELFADSTETRPVAPGFSIPRGPLIAGLLILCAVLLGWRRLGIPPSGVAASVLIVAAALALEGELRAAQQQRGQLAVTEQLGSIRARLESVVNISLSMTNGLAAFIATNPQLDQAQFDAYARAVLEREPALLNLAAAPDMVVRYLYPREGNEAVLGLDYRLVPSQREAAERVLLTGELVVAGPVALVQGGEAIIGRAPVYVDEPGQKRHVWGLVSAPIRLENVLHRAGIVTSENSLAIAMRGRDGRGARGEVFYGDAEVFTAADAVVMTVNIGGGSWQIAARPHPTTGERVERWGLRLLALGVLVLTLVVMRVRAAQHRREQDYSRAMERQAKEDTLTGLPNRPAFKEQLSATLARSTRSGARHALLFIDLDDFKSVNDNLGHDAGDRLLVEVASRVRGCLRSTDTVARLSGDEFTAIVYDINSEDAAAHVAESIVASLGRAYRIDATEVFCGASVGVALYPDDASDPETLMIKADQAMYSVKQAGRNGWHFYTREMHERSERRHRLYNDLVAALDAAQVQTWLQPIVEVASGRIVGCEALARWQRTDGQWVPPVEFVEVAEERGLVNRLDLHMMRRGAEEIRAINNALGAGIGLSINISPRLFLARNQDLERWMEEARAIARDLRLTVEITERLLVGESDQAHRMLSELSAAHIGIALDDFGTGFSSLGYLMRFPVDTIKIDRSFVRGIGIDATSEALVETILAMGRRLGKKVTAEGVETADQLHYLREHGCDFAQGYLLGKPMSPTDFLTQVRANRGAG